MSKFLYPIYKLKIDNYKKWWLYYKKAGSGGILSDIIEGFSLTLENSLARKFKIFSPEGHSEQESTSIADGDEYDSPSPEHEQPIKSAGENVNLFDKDAEPIYSSFITKTVLETGIRLTNTRTWATEGINTSARFKIMDLKGYEGKSITIKTHAKSSSNNYAFFYLRIGDNNANFISDYQLVSSDTTLDGVLKVTLNVPSTLDATYHYLYLTIYGTRMASSITAGDYIDYTDLKIEQGSQATPYSPYGMGSITEKIVNRNLAYVEAEGKFRNYTNGNFVTNAGYNSYIAEVEENTDYMVKSFNNTDFSNLCFFDQNMKYISGLGFNGTTNRQFTTVENCKYVTIAVKNTENQFMITKGTTIPTDYVPHEEQTYSIYTQQPFRSIGDVRDVFFKNTIDSPYYDENLILNGWYERHLPRLVLDGTENWTKISTRFFIELDDITLNGVTKTLCNYFKKSENWVDHSNTNNSIIIFKDNAWNKARLSINSDKFESVDGLKTWLASNDVEVIYDSAIPLNLLCTQSQIDILENIPSTFAGQTNVFSEDEVKAYLRVQYYKEA